MRPAFSVYDMENGISEKFSSFWPPLHQCLADLASPVAVPLIFIVAER